MKTSNPMYRSSMKFSRAYHKEGTFDAWTIIFDPEGDIYTMSFNADMPNGCCIYHGTQCNEEAHGKPVDYTDLPEGIKREIKRLENREEG